MAYITPKLDWNNTDYHNFVDKNRVENNTDFINDLLDFPAVLEPINTTRTNVYIDFDVDFNRIEDNINAVRDAFVEPPNWVTLDANWQPVVTPFGFQVANAWENNIQNLKDSIEGTQEYYLVTGTFYTGTNSNLQRFSRGR